MTGLRVLLIATIALCWFSTQGSCASDGTIIYKKDPNATRLGLTFGNVQNLSQGSSVEQFRRTIQQGDERMRRFQQHGNGGGHYGIAWESQPNGVIYAALSYLVQIRIGSPNSSVLSLIFDPGSALIWTKCFHDSAKYDPSSSGTYSNASCHSPACTTLEKQSHCDAVSNCAYEYKYIDTSYTSGIIAYDTVWVTAVQVTQLPFNHVSFGCSLDEGGTFPLVDGILGMGEGTLSLMSQAGFAFHYFFSHCLGSIDNDTVVSSLFLGLATDIVTGVFVNTPIFANTIYPKFNHRYLGLDGISVAGYPVPYPKGTFDILEKTGTGGFIIDAGNPITYLVQPAYDNFVKAIKDTISAKPVSDPTALSIFDLCYPADVTIEIPTVTFHFRGVAPYDLPPKNVFISSRNFTSGLQCLAFKSAGYEGGLSIFGYIQQQNFHILYDLNRKLLFFTPTDCSDLHL